MSQAECAAPASIAKPERDPFAGLPGHPMMWILIGSELLVFGGALIAFSGARIFDPQGFAAAQNHLDRLSGLANVLVLLTSGYFAALAVEATRIQALLRARLALAAAGVLGVLFLALKGVEFAHHIDAGLTIDSGSFFTLYYLITGFHALHVVLGLVFLGFAARWSSLLNVETAAAFWHMVDLVWLIVFPVIYLVR